MSDLSDLVETFKRAVARPGTFTDNYPETTDDDLLGSLQDAFAESQLDGFFRTGYVSDLDTGFVDPDLTQAEGRLIVIYAAVRFIEVEILNRPVRTDAKAGKAAFASEFSSNLLKALLDSLQRRKDQLVELLAQNGAAAAFYMADAYYVRATHDSRYDGGGGDDFGYPGW